MNMQKTAMNALDWLIFAIVMSIGFAVGGWIAGKVIKG